MHQQKQRSGEHPAVGADNGGVAPRQPVVRAAVEVRPAGQGTGQVGIRGGCLDIVAIGPDRLEGPPFARVGDPPARNLRTRCEIVWRCLRESAYYRHPIALG